MLAQLLARRSVAATTMPHDALSEGTAAGLRGQEARMVCLCYVNPAATQHAHRVAVEGRAASRQQLADRGRLHGGRCL